MISESIFMIRGGSFGEEFTLKLVMSLIGLGICLYDWKVNNNRKDYFWVFLVGTIIWSTAELVQQIIGTRVLQRKYLFGLDITNAFWLTIPLQGMSEGAFVAVVGMLFGDRMFDKKNRKYWIGIFVIALIVRLAMALSNGINFNSVNAGDPSVPSRRDIFPPIAVIFIISMCSIAIIWLITTTPPARKRGISMYLVMVIFIAWWTFTEWLTGQRWIELGMINADGSYSNLRRAPPLIEFLALTYDVVVEVSLIYVPFLAIPYWLGLIKTEDIESIYGLNSKNRERIVS
ncbi:MAG: hypothetical protein GF383_03780 [Candidatus Lokiarchaeota archaeon]|nr:hypothetical protein [Candidatus Lokiarchaeota archaeon]MBD3338815.1 hypothetical protein [Candidatus Lokiarchaeota archaeon]